LHEVDSEGLLAAGMKRDVVTLTSGLTLVIPAWIGVVTPAPTPLHPMPLLTVVPAFILWGWNFRAAVVVPVGLFFAWNPKLLVGSARIPKRSYALLVVLTVLTIVSFVEGWPLGLRYQGLEYTRLVCALNCVWLACIWSIAVHASRVGPSFKLNLLFHWIVCAWLSWYAFPYLGELP
jgi:hypothetical protein